MEKYKDWQHRSQKCFHGYVVTIIEQHNYKSKSDSFGGYSTFKYLVLCIFLAFCPLIFCIVLYNKYFIQNKLKYIFSNNQSLLNSFKFYKKIVNF